TLGRTTGCGIRGIPVGTVTFIKFCSPDTCHIGAACGITYRRAQLCGVRAIVSITFGGTYISRRSKERNTLRSSLLEYWFQGCNPRCGFECFAQTVAIADYRSKIVVDGVLCAVLYIG